jgi:uncharacterized protein (DUF4415 family)
MRNEYDFSKGKRGAIIRTSTEKTRITIRLDNDIVEWFRSRAHEAGGASYQTLINRALRAYIKFSSEPLEETLRRVLREELPRLKRRAG